MLHKLPSEIEAESELKITELMVYFTAKDRYQQDRQALADQQAEIERMRGG